MQQKVSTGAPVALLASFPLPVIQPAHPVASCYLGSMPQEGMGQDKLLGFNAMRRDGKGQACRLGAGCEEEVGQIFLAVVVSIWWCLCAVLFDDF